MHLTDTEIVYDDLWSTAIYSHSAGQYTVTYRVDVEEGFVTNVWQHLPMKSLEVTDQYFDIDLDREVIILQRQTNA